MARTNGHSLRGSDIWMQTQLLTGQSLIAQLKSINVHITNNAKWHPALKKNGKRNRYLTICKELCRYTGQNKAADHYTASLKETAQMMGELAYRHSASASKCLECLWSMMTRSWCFSKKHSRADSGVRAMLHLKLAFSHAQQKPLLWLSSLAKTKSTCKRDTAKHIS